MSPVGSHPPPGEVAGGRRRGRVAVLGGGPGGLAAAFELSKPGWEQRFESITVYQQGFRLGGKGASGRGGPNARIEEHGLHIWLGFYDEAFALLRACYDELGRLPDAPMATIDEAFERASFFALQQPTESGWTPWAARFPETDEAPGLPDQTPGPSLWSSLVTSIRLTRTFMQSVDATPPSVPDDAGSTLRPAGRVAMSNPLVRLGSAMPTAGEVFVDVVERLVDLRRAVTDVVDRTADEALALALALADQLHPDPHRHDPEHHRRLLELIDAAADALPGRRHPSPPMGSVSRRYWYLCDALLAIVRGVLAHGLLTDPDGVWGIDAFDFSEWLVLNRADPESAHSPLIKALCYDLPFSYENGMPDSPRISAASALNGLWHLFFRYRGAIAWKMRSGMGDVVFAPLYEVLKRRGVRFEFFHRVDKLRLSRDHTRIARIEIDVQATLKHPDRGYEPLFDVKGLPCWPNAPLVDQLVDAERMTAFDVESFWSRWPTTRKVLKVGVDFDEVVLGIPVGAHRFVCADLIADDQRWKASSEHLATIYTQSLQLWLTPTADQLGWEWPPVTMGAYLEPFDTYADMRQLIDSEAWPAGAVQTIAYFCNCMPTPPGPPDPKDFGLPARASAAVKAASIAFLTNDIEPIWPAGIERYPTDFKWSLLAATPPLDGPEPVGPDRLDTQYWRANVDPSERYVQAMPNTSKYRLAPGQSGYANLWLAGDWTRGKLNSGCVEAAVSSGLEAARHLRTANAQRRNVAS